MAFAAVGCGSEETAENAVTENAEGVEVVEENGDVAEAEEAVSAEETPQAEEVKPEPIIEGSGTYEEINQEQAKEIMDDEEPAVVIDVRSMEDFEKGHIDGALPIALENINENTRMMIEQFIPRKDQTILIYDNDPERSKKAAQLMADIGYTNVKEFGKIDDWQYGTVEE